MSSFVARDERDDDEAYFGILIGTNNVGKTTQLKELLKLNDRNLVIKPNRFDKAWVGYPTIDVFKIIEAKTDGEFDDYEDLFRGSGKAVRGYQKAVLGEIQRQYRKLEKGTITIYCPHPEVFKRIIHPDKGFTDGGLFFDDFKSYIPSNQPRADVLALLGDRRHKMLDIFAACHYPGNVPPFFYNFNPITYIFKTTRSWKTLKEGFEDPRNYYKLIELKNFVNQVTDVPDSEGQVWEGVPNRCFFVEHKFEF